MAGGLFDPSTLFDALNQMGMLPHWAKQQPRRDMIGAYYPEYNNLMVPPPNNPVDRGTLAHEMTHSIQFALLEPAARAIAAKQRENKDKLTQQELAFLDAYKKIMNTSVGTVGQYNAKEAKQREEIQKRMVTQLYKKSPDKFDQYDSYRTSPIELQAFGIGRMTQGARLPKDEENAPLHLDPSMATEFSILLDMFQRLPKDLQTRAIEDQRKSLENNRLNRLPQTSLKNYTFEDITADPFKSSIK
jgi:hypothetical protein